MGLLIERLVRGAVPWLDPDRPPAGREPERVVLGVRHGLRPSSRPPVRIFLGTERRQFRAERVFLWSVEKLRDPSRIYEIYLMRDLARFRRRLWLTGFTNYRFAIPSLCGYQGRAIYNDTDQVYLRDPAELFDQELGEAGFLAISDRDTSVMLIDCARMAQPWDAESVRRLSRKQLEARARQAGLWGRMDSGWNARDAEYEPGASSLVHFTTLHTQPWWPFPEQFVYFDNPTDPLWQDLEREADSAGFMPVAASRPSSDWPQALRLLSARPDGTVLTRLLAPEAPTDRVPELRLAGVLEHVSDNDLPWVLDRLFGHTERLSMRIEEPLTQREGRYRRSAVFWAQHLRAAAARHPGTAWEVRRTSLGTRRAWRDGPAASGDILVLTHRKPGHDQQALALAEALACQTGRALRRQAVPWSELADLFLRPGRPEWTRDTGILVASGWLPCRVARRLARRANEVPRLVLLGRKSGPPPAHGGVSVQCRHFGLPPHENRIRILLPLNAGRRAKPAATVAWNGWLAASRRVALLVGGASRSHRLDAAEATQLARAVSAWAAERRARLLVVGSRRTGHAMPALRAGLGAEDLWYDWRDGDDSNPYPLALAHADALVVTGESESMLADAVASPAAVFVWPLPTGRPGFLQRLGDRLASLARTPRLNRRGSIRPQTGLQYLAARLLATGIVLPSRDLEGLHAELFRRGLAAPFGAPETLREAYEELEAVASEVLQRIGAAPLPQPGAGEFTEVSHGRQV
jgi:uncharacterized protein